MLFHNKYSYSKHYEQRMAKQRIRTGTNTNDLSADCILAFAVKFNVDFYEGNIRLRDRRNIFV